MSLCRRRLWFVALAGLVLVGGVWMWAIGSSLSIMDVGRIKHGMTRDQVIAAFGRPPIGKSSVLHGLSGDIWEVSDGEIVIDYGDFGVKSCTIIDEHGFWRCQLKRLRAKFGQ